MMSPMVVDFRLRASHSGAGTGITSGTFPPATAAGMVASKPKRRASIQRVPCSHKSENRRSYKSPAMNSASEIGRASCRERVEVLTVPGLWEYEFWPEIERNGSYATWAMVVLNLNSVGSHC